MRALSDINDMLRRIRVYRGISLEKLAEMTGNKLGSVWFFENCSKNRHGINMNKVFALARQYEIPVNDLEKQYEMFIDAVYERLKESHEDYERNSQ